MGRDKKALDGLTFVLDGPTASRSSPDVAEDAVRAALGDVGDVIRGDPHRTAAAARLDRADRPALRGDQPGSDR